MPNWTKELSPTHGGIWPLSAEATCQNWLLLSRGGGSRHQESPHLFWFLEHFLLFLLFVNIFSFFFRLITFLGDSKKAFMAKPLLQPASHKEGKSFKNSTLMLVLVFFLFQLMQVCCGLGVDSLVKKIKFSWQEPVKQKGNPIQKKKIRHNIIQTCFHYKKKWWSR